MSPPPRFGTALMIMLAMASTAIAQRGDQAGEAQPPLPDSLQIPPSPPLEPRQAMATFSVPDGLRVELVAAEPLVIAPVAMTFGPDGRLWIIEMPGYMSDLDGTREREGTGRIVVLEDTDGDGSMDTRGVFLDGLVLPRALAIVDDGVLVVAPPNLVLAQDTDQDGHADTTAILDSSFGGIDSPEHAGNGLRYGMDNWLHCSQHPWEYRYADGAIERRRVGAHGQWGLTSDAWDRWYYTPNSYPLMMDLVPKHVVAMNPAQRDHAGIYVRLPADQAVHSTRINPGVNRAYRKGTLNEDYTLRNFTAACGPTIYLDSVLGESYEGDAFICEPSGNTVEHRNIIERDHQAPELRSDPGIGAIIASTDERFRPVHAETGPDGALYLVDMYRGILQHKIFMTTFLRNQVIDRGLDTPVNLGRIWRIVPDDDEPLVPPDLAALDDVQLVARLSDPNGTVRRLAQQRLVELETRADVTAALQQLAASSNPPLARAHALWTLQGRGELNETLLLEALDDTNPDLRVQALRVAASHAGKPLIRDRILVTLQDENPTIQRHAAVALADVDAELIAPELARALDRSAHDAILRTVIIAGARGHEALLLQELAMLDTWAISAPRAHWDLVRSIVRTAARVNLPDQNLVLLELMASLPPDQYWMAKAMAEELVKLYHLKEATPRTIELSAVPFDWHGRLEELPDPTGGLLTLIDTHATWPGRPGYEPNVDVAGLNQADADLLKRGAVLYTHCTGCHQATGFGLRGFYPPLADSPFVLGEPEPLLAILIKGMQGPVEIDGVTYDLPMPAAPVDSDEDLAALASFVRRSFGNDATLVTPAQVEAARQRSMDHEGPLTVEALEARWPR